MKKKVYFTCLLFILLFFSSCNDFFNGKDFVDSLSNDVYRNQSEYSKVTISADAVSTKSIIPVAGVYESEYKVTDEITIVFEPNPEYSFSCWDIKPEGCVELLDTKKDGSTVTAVMKIQKTANITIKPVCEQAEQLNITFKAENANISPSLPKSYVAGDLFTLECREDDDYYFYGWQVFDADNMEESFDFSAYLKFENGDEGLHSKTVQVEIIGTGKNIIISPVLIKRPKVISSTPIYDSNGSFRNSKIVIMFDEQMNESSVFYSDEEIKELKSKNYTVLTQTGTNKAYGYLNEKGEKFYKNISINQNSKNGVNLNKYYTAPYFDEDNKGTLRISANKDLLPPGATDVYVTFSRKINRLDSNSGLYIPLSSDYTFSFRTSSGIDNYPPFVGKIDESEDDIVIKIIPESEAGNKEIKYDAKWLTIPDTPGEHRAFLTEFENKSEKLWIRCRVGDGDSGICKVECEIDQLFIDYSDELRDWFRPSSEWEKATKEIYSASDDSGVNVKIDKVIDLYGLLREGEYDQDEHGYVLILKVTDFSGNYTESKPFYFYQSDRYEY